MCVRFVQIIEVTEVGETNETCQRRTKVKMPTKQEIINMMENHLPGEPVNIASHDRQPPVYPVLQPPSLANDYPPQRESGIYSVVQAPISK